MPICYKMKTNYYELYVITVITFVRLRPHTYTRACNYEIALH